MKIWQFISIFVVTLWATVSIQFSLFPKSPILAQEVTQATPQASFVVGVSENPPFAIKNGDDWDGIGVHLWREIARNLNMDYQLQEIELNQVIERVEDGTVDLAITAIAAASDEDRVDFTHSYYISSIGVAEQRQRDLIQIVKTFLSPRFLRIAFWLSILFAIVGVLAWAFERHDNDQFEKNPKRGIWTGFWWAGVTMSTIGYGDKTPKTVGGRILALFWMLVAMGITASLTATMTSILTVNSPLESIQVPYDLGQMQIGSIANSDSAKYLTQENIQFQSYSTPLAGLRAVKKGDIDVFVYSVASLDYLNRQSLNNILRIQKTKYKAQRYTFVLPEGHNLYDVLNQQILQETNESDWRNLIQRYLPMNN